MSTTRTIGQEVMRVDFGNEVVKEMKMKFADLFDYLITHVKKAEDTINSNPGIISEETIKNHMEVIRKSEELQRCMSEASKILETSCMYAVKAITA